MLASFKSLLTKKIADYKRQSANSLSTQNHDLQLTQQVLGKKKPKISQLLHINKILDSREKRIFQISFLIFLFSAFWLGINYIGEHRVAVAKSGGKFIEATVGSPQFVNPVFSSTNEVDTDISRLVFSGLMRSDEENNLVPDLAAKYEVSEDKKIFTFELRQDVVWHDGEPFTADDVVFTFDTIQNTAVNSPLNISFQGVSVSALDDYTVRFISQESYPGLLASLTVGILPEHVWFTIAPEQIRLAQTNIQPIGTGPFKFSRFTKDESGHIYTYELKRFERYYRELAYLDEFIFQFYNEYQDELGSIQALRSGKVTALSFVPKQLRDRVTRKHINLYTLQMPQYTALFFNQDKNLFLKNQEVREALAYAIDKERILHEALDDEGQVIEGPLLPGFPGYDSEKVVRQSSVAKANELLDEDWDRVGAEDYRQLRFDELMAEWEENNVVSTSTIEQEEENITEENNNQDNDEVSTSTPREEVEAGINQRLDDEINNSQIFYRKNDDDEFLQIEIVTVGNGEYRQATELIAGFWQEIGVKTKIRYVTARDISREVLKKRDYDVLLYGEIVGSDPDPYPFWHSSQASYPGLNLSSYVNRNVDSLIEKARESTDEEKKAEFYKEFAEQLLTDIPAVFLYMPTYTYATTDEVMGINTKKISQPADRFSDVASWYMKTRGQWNFSSNK